MFVFEIMPPLAAAGAMLLAIADCSATTSFRRPQAPSYRAAIYGSGAKAGCHIARSIAPDLKRTAAIFGRQYILLG